MVAEFGTDAVGWFASAVLLATMVRQVITQWRSRVVGGVSRWLFVGQVTASVGFTLYSVLVHNPVFVVTNALMLANALVGLWVDRRNRAHARTVHEACR